MLTYEEKVISQNVELNLTLNQALKQVLKNDNACFLFSHILFWVRHNMAKGLNFKDGKYWTYDSVKQLQADHFWGMSEREIIHGIKILKDAGYIETNTTYNDNANDRRTWRTLTNKYYDLLLKQYINMRGTLPPIYSRKEDRNLTHDELTASHYGHYEDLSSNDTMSTRENDKETGHITNLSEHITNLSEQSTNLSNVPYTDPYSNTYSYISTDTVSKEKKEESPKAQADAIIDLWCKAKLKGHEKMEFKDPIAAKLIAWSRDRKIPLEDLKKAVMNYIRVKADKNIVYDANWPLSMFIGLVGGQFKGERFFDDNFDITQFKNLNPQVKVNVIVPMSEEHAASLKKEEQQRVKEKAAQYQTRIERSPQEVKSIKDGLNNLIRNLGGNNFSLA
jgi:uncharacterized protein (UPF0335 family)